MSDLEKEVEISRVRDELSNTKAELIKKKETIDNLQKEIRELGHSMKQQISELQYKLENSEKKVESLDALTKSLRESNQEEPTSKLLINDLEKKIIQLENQVYLLEQSEMNLQRQVHSKNVELSECNIEIDRLKLTSESHSASRDKDKDKEKEKESKSGLDNLDEETHNLLNSLIQEIEDLKKEKLDFQEKALQRITEKEMENIELKELLDQTKAEFQKELNDWMIKANESHLSTYESRRDDNDHDNSMDSTQQTEILEKARELEMLNNELKFELDTKAEELEKEKEKYMREAEVLESEYKMRISSLENEITMLKMEVSRVEVEKLQIQRELSSDNETKDSFYRTIEEFQAKIKILEEHREKAEENYKSQIESLNKQSEEAMDSNKKLKEQLSKVNHELLKMQEQSQKKAQEMEDKQNKDSDFKDKQIKALTDKLEFLNKDYTQLKQDYDKFSKTTEKHKANLLEVQDTLKGMRESHNKEIKKWEDKYYDLERKFETEKNSLIENNAKITKQLQQQKTFGKIATYDESKMEPERLNTLDDVLGEEGQEFDNEEGGNGNDNDSGMLRMKIVSLESQITILNNNISDLKFSLDNLLKEKEILHSENKKIKENNAEAVKLYEKQIADLQKNSNKLHVERTSLKRSIIGGDITDSLNPKQLQMLNELNKTIATLRAENKFLVEANEILTKEKNNIQLLRNNDVAYYKDELKKAEQIAVNAKIQFATYVFEKEEEVIKLKQLNKKFMDKLGLTFK